MLPVGAFDTAIYFYYTGKKDVESSSLPDKTSFAEVVHRIMEVISHSRYSGRPGGVGPTVVLLGHDLDAADLMLSIERNCGSRH